jgi:hypothetical protein
MHESRNHPRDQTLAAGDNGTDISLSGTGRRIAESGEHPGRQATIPGRQATISVGFGFRPDIPIPGTSWRSRQDTSKKQETPK